jgi:hypothetical protein
VKAALAAEAALFVAAEGDSSGRTCYTYSPNDSGAQLGDHLEDLEPLSVQTPALRPYGVLLARSIASSGVRKVITLSTGPKISSCATRWLA